MNEVPSNPASPHERVSQIALHTRVDYFFSYSGITVPAEKFPEVSVLAGKASIPSVSNAVVAMIGNAGYRVTNIFIEWDSPDESGKRNRLGYQVDREATVEIARPAVAAATGGPYDADALHGILEQTEWDPETTRHWANMLEPTMVPPPEETTILH